MEYSRCPNRINRDFSSFRRLLVCSIARWLEDQLPTNEATFFATRWYALRVLSIAAIAKSYLLADTLGWEDAEGWRGGKFWHSTAILITVNPQVSVLFVVPAFAGSGPVMDGRCTDAGRLFGEARRKLGRSTCTDTLYMYIRRTMVGTYQMDS